MPTVPAVPAPLAKPDSVNVAFWLVVAVSALLALSALGMLVSSAANGALQTAFDRFPHAGPRYGGPVGLVALAVAVAAFVSALGLNKRRPDAVPWLQRATIAMAALAVVTAAQSIELQRRFAPMMTELMSNLPRGPHPTAVDPMLDMMGRAVTGATSMTLLVTLVMAALKISCCLLALHSARKPAVAAWLRGG
jgi:hypothetical protein